MAANTPARTYTARDFQTLVDALSAYVRKTRPDIWTDMFQANLGQTLIELLAYVGDVASFGQDMALNEAFLSNCLRYDSGIYYARSAGYAPKQAIPASGTVRSTIPVSSGLIISGGTIAAGSTLTGTNGYVYEFLEEVPIAVGQSEIRATVTEGVSRTDTYSPSAAQNQTITTTYGNVAAATWHIFVGDPEVEWQQVTAVALETSATNTYEVLFDSLSRAIFKFGDGTFGAIPGSTVTVEYRTCNGSLGNAAIQTIRGTVSAVIGAGPSTQVLEFENYDPSPETGSTTVNVTDEKVGTLVLGATQSFQFANVPISPTTATVTMNFAGGNVVRLDDDGIGNLILVSGTVPGALTILSAYIDYASGAATVTFSGALISSYASDEPGAVGAYTYLQSIVEGATVGGAMAGGSDRETLAQLKLSVPSFIRSQDRFISPEDYDVGCLRVPGITLAKTDSRPVQYLGNVVRLNVWGEETVAFTSAEGGTAQYKRYAQAVDSAVGTVQSFIRTRTLVTTQHIVDRPGILWVDLYFNDVVYDTKIDATTIRNAITAAVVKVFENSSGFTLRLSEVYSAVYAVPGVLYFTIQRCATGSKASFSGNGSPEETTATAASATVTSRLLESGVDYFGARIAPGSVYLTIDQGINNKTVVRDTAYGTLSGNQVNNPFAVQSGALILSSSYMNYRTGDFSLTFSTVLTSGRAVLSRYDNTLRDYRSSQTLIADNNDAGDLWPPFNYTQTVPVSTASTRFDGKPIAQTTVTTAYDKLTDITVTPAVTDWRFYDNTYFYDNSFYYDSVVSFNEPYRAINLRKLSFNLVARA